MPQEQRGRLKIFMGYAAGVGKTYQMLEEAQDLQGKGIDAVIGYFEPHRRKDTIAKAEGLEVVPRRKLEYRGSAFEEMDTDAVLSRNPRVCVVDEFPHTNIPGSQRIKRWEDVQVLLDAGIDVLTTMNIQHLESLNDQVTQTGVMPALVAGPPSPEKPVEPLPAIVLIVPLLTRRIRWFKESAM